MNRNNNNYLDLLNNDQKKAVINTDGSYLVLAGAGSGKTRVLTFKMLHLLVKKKAFPSQILAVTFTNKAAFEMKSRIASLINQSIDSMWIGTFHSLSSKILRLNYKFAGLKSNFLIIDSDDQLKLIKQICESEKIDTKENTPKYFSNVINNLKNKGIFSKNLTSSKIHQFENNKDLVDKVYSIYQQELKRLNCVDFGDLILHCLKIFDQNKDVCLKYQKLFKYILVDEYQDINHAQQLWLKYLYKFYKNICCVGDDDQSIYSWRGANITNLLNFKKNFTNSKILRLEQNYRSSQNILKCASTLINKNKGRYGKELWSNNEKGEKVIVSGFWETKEEAAFVSEQIEKISLQSISYNKIAILFRVAAHTRSFEERFINLGMPYKIIGGLRFYERKEIKDVIAYLRLVNNLNDNLAYERIINIPKRGIGKSTLSKINLISRKKNISLFEASQIFINENSSKNRFELNEFLINICKWHKLRKDISHIELTQIILEDSKYLEFIKQEEKNLKHI